ncbi:MAG: hypothetical protein COA74_11500 [Gammaproteobacteria bacterium]|nr:MAG: hypothetical protein COA74_11500 [Gammaproteobacteria bacterium]
MDWDSNKVPSPKESMHHVLLMHFNRNEVEVSNRTPHPRFEVAAWLKLKNTEQLPSILVLEYTDRDGEHWEIIDSATIRTQKETVLLSGTSEPQVNYLKEVNVYLCHPTPFIDIEIEELRFNGDLLKTDFLEKFNAA